MLKSMDKGNAALNNRSIDNQENTFHIETILVPLTTNPNQSIPFKTPGLYVSSVSLAVFDHEVELIHIFKCVARARRPAAQTFVRVALSIARIVRAADDLAVPALAPWLLLSAAFLPGTAGPGRPPAPMTRVDFTEARVSLVALAVASTVVAALRNRLVEVRGALL